MLINSNAKRCTKKKECVKHRTDVRPRSKLINVRARIAIDSTVLLPFSCTFVFICSPLFPRRCFVLSNANNTNDAHEYMTEKNAAKNIKHFNSFDWRFVRFERNNLSDFYGAQCRIDIYKLMKCCVLEQKRKTEKSFHCAILQLVTSTKRYCFVTSSVISFLFFFVSISAHRTTEFQKKFQSFRCNCAKLFDVIAHLNVLNSLNLSSACNLSRSREETKDCSSTESCGRWANENWNKLLTDLLISSWNFHSKKGQKDLRVFSIVASNTTK